MGANLISTIDLNKPEIFDFLRDTGASVWEAPITPPGDLVRSAASPKPSGTLTEYAPGKPIALMRSVREYYQVFEGPAPGQNVGNFDVLVPIERTVHLHLFAVLYLAPGLSGSDVRIIEDVFNNYEYARDGDPDQYIHDKLNQHGSIRADMFLVDSTYSIEKVGSEKKWDGERQRIIDTFTGKGAGSVIPGYGRQPIPIDGGQGKGFFELRNLRAVLMRTENVDGVPEKVRDPHEVVSNDPKGAIKEIAAREADDGCGDFELREWKVADLIDYYEWRWRWKDFKIKLGCFYIVITLPVQQSRESRISLWAYARYPRNIGALAEKAIRDCVWESALVSTVIGVVLWNFALGLASFKALFTACIYAKFGNAITCLVPGLLLNTEVVNDWH